MTLAELRQRRDEILNIVRSHGGCSLFDRVRMSQALEDLLGARVESVSPTAIHALLRDSILAAAQRL